MTTLPFLVEAVPAPDDDTIAFAVTLSCGPRVVPRLAVRAPAEVASQDISAVDVVNVEDAGQRPDGRRQVRFIVEATRVATPWRVRLIVDVGDGEGSYEGPEVAAR